MSDNRANPISADGWVKTSTIATVIGTAAAISALVLAWSEYQQLNPRVTSVVVPGSVDNKPFVGQQEPVTLPLGHRVLLDNAPSPPGNDPGLTVPSQSDFDTVNTSTLTSDIIAVEDLDNPEKSSLAFPSPYFNQRIREELGASSTSLHNLRVAVAFIEPLETRHNSVGGILNGYLLVSLVDVPQCSRKFGGQQYDYPEASTGLKRAINEEAPHIATWIRDATIEEKLVCPEH